MTRIKPLHIEGVHFMEVEAIFQTNPKDSSADKSKTK